MEKTKSDFNISILTGDSLFSYILASQILRRFHVDFVAISKFSKNTKRIKGIYQKTSLQYFIYRSFVQVLSLVFKNLTIENYATKNNIKIEYVASKKDLRNIKGPKPDLCIAINFDLIIPNDFISSLDYGVVNVHASNLPQDKGISPVVWAFCRGDEEIYISFYSMDGGIDTGPMILKEKISIDKKWSLFRTYCEVLLCASKTLPQLIKKSSFENLKGSDEYGSGISESYNSWPDKALNKMMRTNKRKYFRFSDLLFLIRTKRKL